MFFYYLLPFNLFYSRFEAFNSVIRQMNIYSNRQACSKDIAQTFAKHKLLQFILNGGCWGEGHR